MVIWIDLEKAVMAKAKKSGLDVTDKEVEDAVEKHADMALGLMEETSPYWNCNITKTT